MALSPLLILLCAGVVIFAILLTLSERDRRDPVRPGSGQGTGIAVAVAGLTAINITGVLGLAWLVVVMLIHDGVMVVELGICAALIAGLAMITGVAFTLRRRGRIVAAVAVLTVAALPTIAAYGFLLYVDTHPVDLR
ncbi:MAG TPA: hypothetical protein VGM87_09865 [Roseomonas sp.]